MEKYLEEGDLSTEEMIRSGLRAKERIANEAGAGHVRNCVQEQRCSGAA